MHTEWVGFQYLQGLLELEVPLFGRSFWKFEAVLAYELNILIADGRRMSAYYSR